MTGVRVRPNFLVCECRPLGNTVLSDDSGTSHYCANRLFRYFTLLHMSVLADNYGISDYCASRQFRYFTLLYCQTIEVLRITMLSDNSGT